jgi:hypothetical protein
MVTPPVVRARLRVDDHGPQLSVQRLGDGRRGPLRRGASHRHPSSASKVKFTGLAHTLGQL